jgi:hypothetical protein
LVAVSSVRAVVLQSGLPLPAVTARPSVPQSVEL